MKETEDLIQCPYCNHIRDYREVLEVGDMAGKFEMECKECEQIFVVDFYSVFHFNSTKK